MALAGELKLPINLHVTDSRLKSFPGRVETPEADFIGLAREYPATTFILAHWGGGLAFDSENRPLKNIYYDSAASSLMYGPEVWRRAVDAVGADHSGHPLAMPYTGGKALMPGEHFERGTNEGDSIVFAPGGIHPGQPLPQVFAVAFYRREHFRGVMFLQQAQFKIVAELRGEHLRRRGLRSSAGNNFDTRRI